MTWAEWWAQWTTPYLSLGQLPPGQEGYIVFEFKQKGIRAKYKKGMGGRWFASVEKPRWHEAKQIINKYMGSGDIY